MEIKSVIILRALIPPEALEAACRADRGSIVAFTAFSGHRSRAHRLATVTWKRPSLRSA